MKRILLLIALLICQFVSAQDTDKKLTVTPSEDDVYNTAGIETKPEFPGGLQAFYHYVSTNYRMPKVKNLTGKVFVTFIVEKNGSLSDIKVIRDIGHGTGKEAKRVLRKSPKWSPGVQNGQPVRVLYSLPISIKT